MEALVRELERDAHVGVFLSSTCNVNALVSAIVARDLTSHDVKDAFRPHCARFATNDAVESTDGDGCSQLEDFVERLDDAVQRIDRVIAEHVGDHHATLLEQVSSVNELQEHVMTVQGAVGQLKQSVQLLESQVREQHEELRDAIQRYRNVEQCSDIVRQVLRFQQLSDRVLGSELHQVDAITSTEGMEETGSSLMGDARQNEMASVALAIREMEVLVQDEKFEKLSVVRAKLPAIRKLGTTLKREVRSALRSSIESLSQAKVGDALQILFYLGDLAATAQASVNDVIQELERKCTAAIAEEKLVVSSEINFNGSNPSNGLSSSNIVQKSDLWKTLQDVFDVIRVHALQVWNLQRVLLKMVDPASGKNYMDLVLVLDEPSLFATFWEVTCAIVRELFASTLSYSTAVKSVLIAEYPRMREQAIRVLNEMYTTTRQSADAEFITNSLNAATETIDAKGGVTEREMTPIAGSVAERTQLLDSMASLYDAFIDRVYRRMLNPIQLMFPQSSSFHASPPGRSDMQTLSRTILSELEQAGHDPVLLDGVLEQVHKAVILFCSNVKRIMHQGKAATATMPSFGRTSAQAHNVGLLNVLSLLDDAIEEVGNRVEFAASRNGSQAESTTSVSCTAGVIATGIVTPKEAKSLCTKSLTPCREMIGDLEYAMLGYYLQALAVLLEDIFAKMHGESFGDESATTGVAASGDAPQSSSVRPSQGTSVSKYMQEFVNAFSVILEEHLRRLPVATFATKCLADFVERLISVFIRHASLLRPLTEIGKRRLANDMTQLELRLEHIVPLCNIGASYEEFCAFRHMIFLENGEILRDTTIDKIRPSNVWHHLTSRAPPELQLPHQMKNWTASKYIEWLDTTRQSLPPTSGKPSAISLSWRELPLGYPCLKDSRLRLQTEKQAWKEMSKCLDAYSQRVSASANAELSPIYDLLQESSTMLLAGYEVMDSRQMK